MSKNTLQNMEFSFDLKMSHEIETASAEDPDLLHIRCFSCHEGINENGVLFLRQVLKNSYKSFIDKPVVIVPGKRSNPTGHGYDYKRKKFDETKRKYVGHITNAFPCIVGDDGSVTDVSYKSEDEYPNGEYRIVCDLVIYKKYMVGLSEMLTDLHIDGNLKFSMESVVDYDMTPEGIKHCKAIHFTALAIVQNPAFKNSYSLEVAEKEEEYMDFEQLYNAEKEKNETLIAEKTTLEAEKATAIAEKEAAEAELATVKESLAEANGTIADKDAEIASLGKYKEQVETAEKKALGEERKAKLEKYGDVAQTVDELAEMSKEDFVDALETAVASYEPAIKLDIKGTYVHENTAKSNAERLSELLSDLCK